VRLGDESLEQFAARLAGEGVTLKSGPFVIRLNISLPELAEPLYLLYRDFPVCDEDFADYRVKVELAPKLFPWSEQKCRFLRDDASPVPDFSRDVALAMMEWGLNWCFYSQADQFLNIHAAVVAKNDQAMILPGRPGIGKSTLCAALVHRGWRLLSDELALIRPGDGRLWPTVRPISLKNTSIDLIRDFAPEAVLGPEIENTFKGRIALVRPPRDSVLSADVAAQPTWIVFPRYVSARPDGLTTVPRTRGFFRLADNSFNYRILGEIAFLETCKLVETCPCFDLTYSSLEEAVAIVDRLPIEQAALSEP
jgi:HprK-related kinase A